MFCKQIEMVVVIVEGMQCNGSKNVSRVRNTNMFVFGSRYAFIYFIIFFIKLTLLLLLRRRSRRGKKIEEISLSRSHSFNFATQMQFTCPKAQRIETRFN